MNDILNSEAVISMVDTCSGPGVEVEAVLHTFIFDEIALESNRAGHLAVVTHGLVCHSILARKVEPSNTEPPAGYGRDGPPIRFGNTALTILSHTSGTWSIDLFACTAHLDDATDSSVA